MKSMLIALFIIAFAYESKALDWRILPPSSTNEIIYFDADSMEIRTNESLVWTRVYRAKKIENIKYSVSRTRFDCKGRSLQIIYSATYDQNGVQQGASNTPMDLAMIVPGTIGDEVWSNFCNPTGSAKRVFDGLRKINSSDLELYATYYFLEVEKSRARLLDDQLH